MRLGLGASVTQDLRALSSTTPYSEALAEQPAVARTQPWSVELHGDELRAASGSCLQRRSSVPKHKAVFFDGVARASSAGTSKSGSSAPRSLALHTMLAPIVSRTARFMGLGGTS